MRAILLSVLSLLVFIGNSQRTLAESRASDQMIRLGTIEHMQVWYEALRDTLNEYGQVYDVAHRKATIVVDPTFDDVWLIVIETHPAVTVRRSETWTANLHETTAIRVARLSWSSGTDNQDIPPSDEGVHHKRLTKDFYFKSISEKEFDTVFKDIATLIDAEPVVSDSENGCTDGVTAFAEVLTHDQEKLISRHSCDKDYAAFLKALKPLFELGWSKIPYIEADLQELWKVEARDAIN